MGQNIGVVAWIIVITAVAGVGGTGVGGALGAAFRRDSDRTVSLLLSFAGGVMLGVVCFDLLVSAVHPGGSADGAGVYFVIFGVLLGYGVVFALNHFIDRSANAGLEHIDARHPRTADALDELIHYDYVLQQRARRGGGRMGAVEYRPRPRMLGRTGRNARLFAAGLIMACAIALHNIPEGMVIGASYAGAERGVTFSGGGLVLAAVIGLHDIPEGMAVAVPLISGGMRRGSAVLATALTGVPTVLGALLGYFLGAASPRSLSLSLSFASGAMLYVVFGELLPEAILMWRSKAPAFAVLAGLLTGLFMIFV